MNKEALWEAVKFPLRQLVLALLPFLIAYFASLPYEWAGVAFGIVSFLDKYLYELWKVGESKARGISPF